MTSLSFKTASTLTKIIRFKCSSARMKIIKHQPPPYFLILPCEIRDQIYNHILGNRQVSISVNHQHKGHETTHCTCKKIPSTTNARFIPRAIHADEQDAYDRGLRPCSTIPTPLLLTSRRLHAEASATIYSTSLFTFRSLSDLAFFAKRIPSYVPLIRHIVLVFPLLSAPDIKWKTRAITKAVARGLSNLRTLILRPEAFNTRVWTIYEARWQLR
jgi:hypothetical protein